VARGHAVAQRQRLDHRGQQTDLHRGEPLGALAREQQLGQQVLEDDQHEHHQRHRGQAGAHVDGGDERAQQGADELVRQDRDEDRAELPAQRHAVVEAVVAGDHHEVQDDGHHEDDQHHEREPRTVAGDAERVDRPVGEQPADEREGGERRDVGDQPRERVARAEVIGEHGGDADRRRRGRAEQRHRQHQREKRAGDALALVADGEQVAAERERQQDEHETDGMPVVSRRRERGDGRRDGRQRTLRDDQRC
jgi:hypothetical protein